MTIRAHLTRAVALCAAAVLTLSACGSDDEGPGTADPGTSTPGTEVATDTTAEQTTPDGDAPDATEPVDGGPGSTEGTCELVAASAVSTVLGSDVGSSPSFDGTFDTCIYSGMTAVSASTGFAAGAAATFADHVAIVEMTATDPTVTEPTVAAGTATLITATNALGGPTATALIAVGDDVFKASASLTTEATPEAVGTAATELLDQLVAAAG